MVSYWIDNLVLKNRGKYLRYFTVSSSPLRGKPTQCLRGNKKNFWHHCRGGSCKQVNNTKYPSKSLSLALHYLPFASRFTLPHFTRAIFLPSLSQSPPLFPVLPFSRCLSVCLCANSFACLSSCPVPYPLLCPPSLKFFTSSKGKEKI